MIVEELWRYPVKSLGGERLGEASVDVLGIEGDRRWGIVDPASRRVLTGRRDPVLLHGRARHLGPGQVAIDLPDGTTTGSDDPDVDAVLSGWVGRPVALMASTAATLTPQFEVPDAEDESRSQMADAAPGAWHDSPAARLSLLSRATLGDWHPRRFRSNVLLSGDGEDDLVGRAFVLGGATMTVSRPIRRCVMVNRPQPEVDEDPTVFRAIAGSGGTLAVGATVTTPGPVAEGAELRVLDPEA